MSKEISRLLDEQRAKPVEGEAAKVVKGFNKLIAQEMLTPYWENHTKEAMALIEKLTQPVEGEAAEVVKNIDRIILDYEMEFNAEDHIQLTQAMNLIENLSYELNIAKGSLRNLNQANLDQFNRIAEQERIRRETVNYAMTEASKLRERIAELELK